MNRIYIKLIALGLPLVFASCGAKKILVKETPVMQKTTEKSEKNADALELKKQFHYQRNIDLVFLHSFLRDYVVQVRQEDILLVHYKDFHL